MKRLALLLTLLAYGSTAWADSSSLNLALPSAPGTFGQDSIRAGDLDCKNAIGGATQLEFGVTGIVNNATSPFSSGDPLNPQTKDVGVYARIVIPLGAKAKERINCNDLYELELQVKRLEVQRLERELEQLRALQFEN